MEIPTEKMVVFNMRWMVVYSWAFVVELWRFVSSDMASMLSAAEYESYTRGVLLASPKLNVEYIYIYNEVKVYRGPLLRMNWVARCFLQLLSELLSHLPKVPCVTSGCLSRSQAKRLGLTHRGVKISGGSKTSLGVSENVV